MRQLLSRFWRRLKEMWLFWKITGEFAHLRVASPAEYARRTMQASYVVDQLRKLNPGRNFLWTFSTNHVLDSGCCYICIYEHYHLPGTAGHLSFHYHGPVQILMRKMLEGKMDEIIPYRHPTLDLVKVKDEFTVRYKDSRL